MVIYTNMELQGKQGLGTRNEAKSRKKSKFGRN
jgi:hypothetical protein